VVNDYLLTVMVLQLVVSEEAVSREVEVEEGALGEAAVEDETKNNKRLLRIQRGSSFRIRARAVRVEGNCFLLFARLQQKCLTITSYS
jgi:hypothetical protein